MKTDPYPHQQECFDKTKDLENYALLYEMGLGKSKILIDTFCHNFLKGRIDAVLILAPNAVAPNWKNDQLPVHMWDEVPYYCHGWDSKKTATKKFRSSFDWALEFHGLSIISMNYEAVCTKKGTEFLREFFAKRKVFMICDESHRIKTPSAKVTKKVILAGKQCEMRRIATGTVISNSAFDVYSQFNFLDKNILGYKTFSSFKSRFGIFERGYGYGGVTFDSFVEYKNLDELTALIKNYSDRLLKEDVLDLPPKLYEKRYVESTPEIHKAYKQMKEELVYELCTGQEVTAPLAMTCLMKLQQITSGFIMSDSGTHEIQGKNPKAEYLISLIDELNGKIIIWGKFRHDFEIIRRHLVTAGYTGQFVEYHGEVSNGDREEARVRFQEDDNCRIFLGNPSAAGEGLTLHKATNAIYYNNSFKYIDRRQSEDRCHRIGTTKNVLYIDLIMEGTVDENITKALSKKNDVATLVQGDKVQEWL